MDAKETKRLVNSKNEEEFKLWIIQTLVVIEYKLDKLKKKKKK